MSLAVINFTALDLFNRIAIFTGIHLMLLSG